MKLLHANGVLLDAVIGNPHIGLCYRGMVVRGPFRLGPCHQRPEKLRATSAAPT